MRMTTLLLATLLGCFALVGKAQATVLRVVVVQTNDAAAYLKDLEAIRGHNARLGSKSVLRAWRARFAGEDAGSIVVAIEYADMAAFAAEDARMRADAELSALLKAMDGRRKIVSDSLYEELK